MGLAEVLAAKRAKQEAEAAQAQPQNINANAVSVGQATEQPVAKTEQAVQTVVPQAVAPLMQDKPLSFAEKMALKKQQEQAAAQKEVAAPASVPLQTVVAAQKQAVALQAESAPADEQDANIRQAYAEIAQKIDELASFSTEDLSGAMSSLKKALMQNPAACELMLDEDIGKMVIALRRVTNTTIAEAKEAKTPKAKKQKMVDVSNLSADEMLAVWDEI